MTRVGYAFARLLSSFGLNFTEKYRNSAAFESHILQESFEVIGSLAWKDCEHVEALSADYWQLRKIEKKHNQITQKNQKLLQIVDSSHEARASAVEQMTLETKDKVDRRQELIAKTEALRVENEEILREGRSLRRHHDGLKAKLEIFLDELPESSPEITSSRKEITHVKQAFKKLKNRSQEIKEQSAIYEKELLKLRQKIADEKKAVQEHAESNFGNIGRANKELNSTRAELSSITQDYTNTIISVGSYILNNADDPDIKKITQENRQLLKILGCIQRSRFRHNKLISGPS